MQPPLVVLQVNYWKKVWFPIQTPVFGDESGRSDGYRWRRSGQQCAGGSTPCGGTFPTPRIAVSKWKLAILQVNFRPKVPFFWVFPYKTGDTKITAKGKELTKFNARVPNNHWTRNLAASPDGKKIAFTVRQGGFAIAVMDLATGVSRIVAEGQDPAWGADSRHVIYSDGSSIMLLDTLKGRRTPVISGLGKVSEPSWSR